MPKYERLREAQYFGVPTRKVDGTAHGAAYRAARDLCWDGGSKVGDLTEPALEYVLANFDTFAAESYWFGVNLIKRLKLILRSGNAPWLLGCLRGSLTWLPADAAVRKRVAGLLEREAPSTTPSPGAHDDGAMLRAIAEDPRGDAPRLVYADALMERGEPFGEYLQASVLVERARGEHKRSLEQQLKRAEKSIVPWLGPLKKQASSLEYERGLPSEITLQAVKAPQAVVMVARAAPWAVVRVVGLKRKMSAAFANLLSAPWGDVHGLRFQDPLSNEHLEALAAAPSLKGLQLLDIAGAFTQLGVEHLLQSAALGRPMKALALTRAANANSAAQRVSGPILGEAELRAIVARCPALEALAVRVVSAAALKALNPLRNLRELTVEVDVLRADELKALLSVPVVKQLVALKIHAQSYAGVTKAQLASLRKLKNLQVVLCDLLDAAHARRGYQAKTYEFMFMPDDLDDPVWSRVRFIVV